MSSRQRQAVPEIIQRIAECEVETGLMLGGSVACGRAQHDSDLDFFAIGAPGLDKALHEFHLISEKNGCKLLELKRGAFPIHIAYWTTESMNQVLRDIPYMTYPLLAADIVHDPTGVAGRYQAKIRHYFEERPDITNAWQRQLEDLWRFKEGELQTLAFPAWSDFMKHIETTFENR